MVALSSLTHFGQLIEGGVPVVVVCSWAALWVGAFVEVVSAKREEFAGPYVRLCWVGGLLLVPELTPFAFLAWHLLVRRRRSRARAHDAPTPDTAG